MDDMIYEEKEVYNSIIYNEMIVFLPKNIVKPFKCK